MRADGRRTARPRLLREATMTINRRQLAFVALAAGVLPSLEVNAQGGGQDAVAKNVEAFRQAQIAKDSATLDRLCAAELSYSHSDARVEDKATFIANATVNSKSKFVSLDYGEAQVRVVGDTATVRFHWVAEAEALSGG